MTREEMRQRVNAEDIRNWYTFERSKGGLYCCPICGSGTGTHKTGALQINDQGNRIICHACGKFGSQGEDTLGALKILLNTDERGVFEYMRLSEGAAARQTVPQPRQTVAAAAVPELPEADYTEFFAEAHRHIDSINYPRRRGLTQKTIEHFNLGYVEEWRHPSAPTAPTSPRLIIPTGKGSYLARDVRENVPESARGYEKQKCGKQPIFNAEALRGNEPVFVVEGEIDAMSLYEVGCAAVGLGSIGQVGKLLKVIDKGIEDRSISAGTLTLVIALDNEENANVERAAAELEKGCAERGIKTLRGNPHEGYKDPNAALMADREAFTRQAIAIIDGLRCPHSVSEYLMRGFAQDIESFQAGAKYKTGFDNLDAEIGHIYPGLYVLGAISSLGKTTFSLQVADQIAAAGHDVLFFSLEQSRFELVSKSLSRNMAQHDKRTAQTALTIRAQFGEHEAADNAVLEAVQRQIAAAGHHMNIIEGSMNTNLQLIETEVRQHVQRTKRHPVVFIDYLQILKNAEADRNATLREVTDRNVTALKILSRELDVPIFVISSINRSNYLTPIDFESFKESGGIEYSADVVWGLQLRILNDDTFDREGNVKQKREKVREAKSEVPRQIELVCLKNRFGKSSFSCFFEYEPQFDLYRGVSAQTNAPQKKIHRL